VKQRTPSTNETVTRTVNEALGQLGCNYCRLYKPASQVRKKRSLSGGLKNICDTCDTGRKAAKGA
jgi:hypothetical protein